ncbi:MAG: STAS domain-containing protein [Deltaproteobacteria bacterium]|nr:STAS domain-containing protein [Deltaproteobacteria bacterium]
MKVVLKIEDDISSLRNWDEFSEKLMKLVDSGFSEITIDLQGVKKISSLALGAIVASHQKMSSAGRRLVVANICDELKKLLGETKILSMIDTR